MAIYPDIHGEPFLEEAPEEKQGGAQPREDRGKKPEQKQGNEELEWKREFLQKRFRGLRKTLAPPVTARGMTPKAPDTPTGGAKEFEAVGDAQKSALGTSESEAQKLPREVPARRNLEEKRALSRSIAARAQLAQPEVSERTALTSLAVSMAKKRLRMIILGAVSGFLAANLPIIIIFFVALIASAALLAEMG